MKKEKILYCVEHPPHAVALLFPAHIRLKASVLLRTMSSWNPTMARYNTNIIATMITVLTIAA